MATRSASTTGINPGTAGRRARNEGGDANPVIDVRVPPHNITAEASLLGAMLLSRDAIADAIEIVRPEHFYKPAHAHIFDAIVTLYGAGEPVDPVTVAEVLDRAALLESLGGAGVIVDLQASTPAIASVSRYARIVQEHATLRRLIGVAHDIADIAYAKPDDVVKAVDRAESLIYEVGQGRVADTMSQIRDLLDANLDRLEQLYERGQTITGTPSGYIDLDDILGGMQPSALIVVGARPAMGKTSFALGMAAHAAIESDLPVVVFSLEMSQLELSQRLLCSESRVDSKNVRDGKLTEADWKKISHGVGRLAEAPIFIDDNPNVTVMEIRAKTRRLKSRLGKLGLIVVDYLQLMTGRSSADNRQVEVAEISRGLKILARELETPVVALSQLSRNLEARQDKRPMLADLRESGAIEQDADVVLFIYRDEIYHPDTSDLGTAEIIIAKHRNGPTGHVRLAFLPHYTRFANMAKGV
jgi:replicative DNA helicase